MTDETDQAQKPPKRIGYKVPPGTRGKMPKREKTLSCSKTSAAIRKKTFAERYLVNGNNASEAARFAGYSGKTVANHGWRLLRDPLVKSILGDRAEKLLRETQLSTERWAKEMAAIAHLDPGELYDADGNLIPIHLLPEHVRRAIASVEVQRETATMKPADGGKDAKIVNEDTVKIKFWDKNTALANVGKHLGVFEQDNRQRTAPIQVVVQLMG